jgi:hypothetical protein
MSGLKRYIEWMSRGRRTNREVYALKEWNLPNPVPGAEWQLDKTFNLADELLRDPELKTVFRAALEKGVRPPSASGEKAIACAVSIQSPPTKPPSLRCTASSTAMSATSRRCPASFRIIRLRWSATPRLAPK